MHVTGKEESRENGRAQKQGKCVVDTLKLPITFATTRGYNNHHKLRDKVQTLNFVFNKIIKVR
jgi:hypothetical protein